MSKSATQKSFTEKQLQKQLAALSGWKLSHKNSRITKTVAVPNYVTALALCARIIVHAEVLQHSPELTISAHQVKITLTTPSVRNLTKLDFALAERIEKLV